MNLKQKFNLIDQSKLEEKQVEILKSIQAKTNNFSLKDEEVVSRIDQALDKIIQSLKEKNPDAIKTQSRTKKQSTTKGAKKTKTSTTRKTSTSGKRTLFSVAKEIRKADESWDDAKSRAKKVMEDENKQATQKMKSETEKLLAFIKRKKELDGLSGTSIKKDSKVEALPKGRRVSKKGWKNQYGESEGGRVYYENRDNRSDRLAPNFADKVYLENGGGTESKLKAGVYRVGKPIKVNANLYEQKIVEIFDNGDIATASDYGRNLSDFKSMKYEIISREKLNSMYSQGGGTKGYVEITNPQKQLFDKGYRIYGGDSWETLQDLKKSYSGRSLPKDAMIVKVKGGKVDYFAVAEKERVYEGGGYVVIAKSEKGGGFVMSKPSTKAKAEKLKSMLTKIDGETNEVMTVAKASKLNGLVGKEYLKYAYGGTLPKTVLKKIYEVQEKTTKGGFFPEFKSGYKYEFLVFGNYYAIGIKDNLSKEFPVHYYIYNSDYKFLGGADSIKSKSKIEEHKLTKEDFIGTKFVGYKYADGGAIIGTPETPLARGLDMDYTTLVGETGAMSSGELFAKGGGVGSKKYKKGDKITTEFGTYYVDGVDQELQEYIDKNKSMGLDYVLALKNVNIVYSKYFNEVNEVTATLRSWFDDKKQPSERQVRNAMIWSYDSYMDYQIKAGGGSKSDSEFSSMMRIGISDANGNDKDVAILKKYSTEFKEVLITIKEIQALEEVLETKGAKNKKSKNKLFASIDFLYKADLIGIAYDINGKPVSKETLNKIFNNVVKEYSKEEINSAFDRKIKSMTDELKYEYIGDTEEIVTQRNSKTKHKINILETLRDKFNSEKFEQGGSTGLPAGAEQHYVNHYINEGASAGIFANGGGVIYKDLFEDYTNQPDELREIVSSYMEKFEEDDYDYEDSKNFLNEVEAVGYTFDYGLDNEPYALRPIGVKLSQIEGFEDSEDEDDDYFKKGGNVKRNLSRDRMFLNHSEDYEVRYSKGKKHRSGYTKPKMSRTQFEEETFEFFDNGGNMPTCTVQKHKND